MKKNIIFCLCMAVAMMFTACNKDQDGVYNPAKKIQKIYSVENGVQQVEEVWHWDGNLLNSIDLYEEGQLYNTTTFKYDGNRLTTLQNGYSYAKFYYEGKKINRVEVYYTGFEEPIGLYLFDYKGNKLSQIYMEFDMSSFIDKKALVNPLKYILPASCSKVENLIAQHENEAKEYKESMTMQFTWTGNNVTSIILIEENTFGDATNTVTSFNQCTFDNKENPVKGFISALFGATNIENFYCNKNNILKSTTTQDDIEYYTTENVYEYEDKYPVKVTTTTTDGEGTVFVDSYIYEY